MCDFEYKAKKSRRIAAAVLSAAILFGLLFSMCFIAEKAHHDCIGKGCPVCAGIVECVKTLQNISNGVQNPKTPVLLIVSAAAAVIAVFRQVFLSDTLVSQKIRQNN